MKPSSRAEAIIPSAIRDLTERAGPQSLHLGLGQPDTPMHPSVLEAIRDAIAPLANYGPNLGTLQARKAVADHYGVELDSVLITAGVQEGLALSVLGLVEPGQKVLVPNPGFPAYPNLVRAAHATPVYYDLGGDWSLDLQRIEASWEVGVKAIIINSPGNPTGAVFTEAEIRKLVEWCEEREITIISDEIYEDFVYEGVHFSAFEASNSSVIRLSGLSKSHSMMGWRLGWLIAEPSFVQGLKGLHQHLVTSAVVPIQDVIPTALAVHGEHTRAAVKTFSTRRDTLIQALRAEWPQMPEAVTAGAFYLLLDVRTASDRFGGSYPLALNILQEIDVVAIPGSGFGSGAEGYLRLAYTVEESKLEVAGARLGAYLKQIE